MSEYKIVKNYYFLITFVTVLHMVVGYNTRYCQIYPEDTTEHNYVFTEINESGKLNILKTDVVPIGQQLHLICTSSDSSVVTCQSDGHLTPALSSLSKCVKPPTIATLQMNTECALGAKYIAVGYDIEYRGISQFLEIYRVCYSPSDIKTYFTVHQTQHYSIVTPRPNAAFIGGGIIPGNAYLMYKSDKLFETFNSLLGKDQQYIPDSRATIIARGHLTPSGDFLFADQMKATFRYVNAVPQFHIINLSNWKKIENWVKQKTASTQLVQVITGAHGILELPHSSENRSVKLYLKPSSQKGEPDQIPVPKWMYKIVKINSEISVFITYNNPYATEAPELICRRKHCPRDIANPTWNDFTKGYTYCCDITDFKRRVLATVPI